MTADFLVSNYPMPWNCRNSAFFPKMEAELQQSSPPPRNARPSLLQGPPPCTQGPYRDGYHEFTEKTENKTGFPGREAAGARGPARLPHGPRSSPGPLRRIPRPSASARHPLLTAPPRGRRAGEPSLPKPSGASAGRARSPPLLTSGGDQEGEEHRRDKEPPPPHGCWPHTTRRPLPDSRSRHPPRPLPPARRAAPRRPPPRGWVREAEHAPAGSCPSAAGGRRRARAARSWSRPAGAAPGGAEPPKGQRPAWQRGGERALPRAGGVAAALLRAAAVGRALPRGWRALSAIAASPRRAEPRSPAG